MGLRVSAIVLAAGLGTRFGGGKVRAEIAGKPMLQHVLDRLANAGFEDVVVVLGRDAQAVEEAVHWRAERRVRNVRPEDGLAGSVRLGFEAVGEGPDAVLVLLGDQPLVDGSVLGALVEAADRAPTPFVVPEYANRGGSNPVLVRRAGFDLVTQTSGDRGLGPVLAARPDLVTRVPVAGDNPDIDTRSDLASAIARSWAARVRANAEQVDRFREVPDGADFYAPVRSLFRADPTRTDDPVLQALLERVEPGETWLDVGAGAGRFALPIALALRPGGGRVIAVDVSPSMLEALSEIAAEHGVDNVETIEGRWPLPPGASPTADVSLIAQVGYDIEDIGPFVDALEAATRRLCVAVLMDRAPASAADAFWPLVHGEERVPLPGLPDLLELLEARGRTPEVRRVVAPARTFESQEALAGFVRRQLWIDPSGPKESAFQRALDHFAVVDDQGGWTLRGRPSTDIGTATWSPIAAANGEPA